MKETHIVRELERAGSSCQFDENVKNVLALKGILAYILKASMKEVKAMSIAEIKACLSNEIMVSSVSIAPGETRKTSQPEKISGDAQEDAVPTEGRITFDIRFHLWLPGKDGSGESTRVKLLVDLEAQKSMNLKYKVVTRGIFYGARMISAQRETEFKGSNYQEIKKVYSIWVCMNAPNYLGNRIENYSIDRKENANTAQCIPADAVPAVGTGQSSNAPETKTGSAVTSAISDHPENYDKIEVVIIYLNEAMDKNERTIFHLLNTILSPRKSREEKIAVLRKFDIPVEKSEEEEIDAMCNLSEAIYDCGLEDGREDIIRNMLSKKLKLLEICELTQSSLETVKEIQKKMKPEI